MREASRRTKTREAARTLDSSNRVKRSTPPYTVRAAEHSAAETVPCEKSDAEEIRHFVPHHITTAGDQIILLEVLRGLNVRQGVMRDGIGVRLSTFNVDYLFVKQRQRRLKKFGVDLHIVV